MNSKSIRCGVDCRHCSRTSVYCVVRSLSIRSLFRLCDVMWFWSMLRSPRRCFVNRRCNETSGIDALRFACISRHGISIKARSWRDSSPSRRLMYRVTSRNDTGNQWSSKQSQRAVVVRCVWRRTVIEKWIVRFHSSGQCCREHRCEALMSKTVYSAVDAKGSYL